MNIGKEVREIEVEPLEMPQGIPQREPIIQPQPHPDPVETPQ